MKELLSHIISSIGMNLAELSNNQSNPIAWYCDEEGNEGMTASAILTTSHVAFHVWDNLEVPEIHFDLYSCSDFSAEEVTQILHENFSLINGKGLVRDRLNGLTTHLEISPGYFSSTRF